MKTATSNLIRLSSLLLAWLLPVMTAQGLGPHELLVLANAKSVESIELADYYARLRDIPPENVIRLVMPAGKEMSLTISPDDFTRLIWGPANRIAGERGIARHILAWAYSVDFPTTIEGHPPMSIQGLTFLRNRLPRSELVEDGTYVSPLYAGPMRAGGDVHESQTLDAYRDWLGRDMPLPNMMLGWRGENGNSMQTIRDCLARGKASDHSFPTGTVYYIKTDDVRSTARDWQFTDAGSRLAQQGVTAETLSDPSQRLRNVIGLQIGLAQVRPDRYDLLPGSMAEHLTSAGAVFRGKNQTKITEWIKAGATATAGTVTEPYAIWPKFPSAYFFVHYSAGCTMLESFAQSLGSPLQILLLGDPLAAPWRPSGSLEIDEIDGSATLHAVEPILAGLPFFVGRLNYYLDGKFLGEGRTMSIQPATMDPGNHELRVVACQTGVLRHQLYTRKRFVVPER